MKKHLKHGKREFFKIFKLFSNKITIQTKNYLNLHYSYKKTLKYTLKKYL